LEAALWPAPDSVAYYRAEKDCWEIEALYAAHDHEDATAYRFKIDEIAANTGITFVSYNFDLLEERNWVKDSLQGLSPIVTDRYFVCGSHDQHLAPGGMIPVVIEAGEAFGTGHHATTRSCLNALGLLSLSGPRSSVLDAGCGTGVLAIASAKTFSTKTIAFDIDPIAVQTARENVKKNGVSNYVHCLEAGGPSHPEIQRSAPFDLILANILAGPLTQLASQFAPALSRRGALVLSGLLSTQEARVLSVFRAVNLYLNHRIVSGEWSTLILGKTPAHAYGLRQRDDGNK
jgi:ribosomal protein L11 methyltransferase